MRFSSKRTAKTSLCRASIENACTAKTLCRAFYFMAHGKDIFFAVRFPPAHDKHFFPPTVNRR
jgi:hypothetical protein